MRPQPLDLRAGQRKQCRLGTRKERRAQQQERHGQQRRNMIRKYLHADSTFFFTAPI
jgi:hypothetical protein